MTYDAIIIGAGHNGLTAAAYLAKAGLRVLALERSEVIGGAAVSEQAWPGWTVSVASYVNSLLLPQVIEDLELREHGYDAYRKQPFSFTPMLDGRSLLLGADCDANEREIAAFSSRDARGYQEYSREAERLGGLLHASMTDDEPNFARTFGERDRVILTGSVADFVEPYVDTPVLQAALVNDGLIGTFAGPRTPGTAYVLAVHCAGRALGVQGAWAFVRGGMGAVSRALAGAAWAHGAEIKTASPVASVITQGERATGVALKDGTEFRARYVLSNAHPKTTFLELVPRAVLPAALLERVNAWKSVGVSFKLNLALSEPPNYTARPAKGLAPHHNASVHVAPSIEYLQRAYEDAAGGSISRAPMLECFMASPTDPSLVPPGKHLLSIFAQYFPYDRSDGPWTTAQREAAADQIVATLAQYAPNLPGAIEARQALSPADLETRFGMVGGHIFHGELLPGQIYENRFAVRTPLLGLYLCGSGTHPGGCVTGAPGYRAAHAVLADVANAVPRS